MCLPNNSIATISLNNILHNLLTIQKAVYPAKVMSVVKANAYGHGIEEVSLFIDTYTDYFAVAQLQEALLLRKINVTKPILIMGAMQEQELQLAIQSDMECCLPSFHLLKVANDVAQQLQKKVIAHLKFDTGMGRLGFHWLDLQKVIQTVKQLPMVTIKGVFSHFACSDNPTHELNAVQIQRFSVIQNTIKNIFPHILSHFANSGAILHFSEVYYDIVRAGIALYGTPPSIHSKKILPLLETLNLQARISQVKLIKKGDTVSYNAQWIAKEDSYIAIINIGYADGLPRSLSHKNFFVSIDGKKYPLIGTICMDSCIALLGKEKISVDKHATFIGESKNMKITVEEFALQCQTIPYEIFTSLGTRVKRHYKK